ncbi:MAG TPA: 50S ribosomal protein L10 [Polyangiaceae bacterium]|jgi:large subunit ribosomal protein L10|nr:50S ribosomal protein L10 [Polyangiaceae bacterium]
MDRATKAASITEIKGRFDKMTSAVFLDFKGMTVGEVSKLRTEFRKNGVEYRVVKNTLVKKAIADKPWSTVVDATLKGFTGVALSYEDPSAAAKVIKAFRKDNEKLKIKAGLVEGQLLDSKAVEDQLATMPGKNELRAMLLATMQAPLQNFVALLQAPTQNFVYALAAKEREENK